MTADEIKDVINDRFSLHSAIKVQQIILQILNVCDKYENINFITDTYKNDSEMQCSINYTLQKLGFSLEIDYDDNTYKISW